MSVTINGKEYELSPGDKFTVEIGFGEKGGYKVRNCFDYDKPGQAVLIYNAINIGRGYKKRLRLNKKVIARVYS